MTMIQMMIMLMMMIIICLPILGSAFRSDFYFLSARRQRCLQWVPLAGNESLMDEFGIIGGCDPKDGQVGL